MKINIKYWMRTIHRDVGFLMVGITIVYAFSGILLNHMNGKNPSYETLEAQLTLDKGLSSSQLNAQWKSNETLPPLRKSVVIDSVLIRLYLEGGIGAYNCKTGELDYQISRKRPVIYWMNNLHYNRIKGWSWTADIFAISLIFLAISGILMVPGKKGIKGRGKWYLIAGILIPLLYVLLNK
ncbi:PepSY-associated TM helix domain-containing protein [Halosquirtibacter laminarini]|uniref:PepSY-associated TM helix domain-containing protein n=1 Tax=Halosquirtibacter laminarini TaxID=3374600 RepID=A0AC61NJC9_9BACT|nr:PepSY-associated TM helix domain-containing protein [Prolixibacteraceae bacterium]